MIVATNSDFCIKKSSTLTATFLNWVKETHKNNPGNGNQKEIIYYEDLVFK